MSAAREAVLINFIGNSITDLINYVNKYLLEKTYGGRENEIQCNNF